MSSQGFIETIGMVGAMEAADAMTKAAHVHLEKVNFVACGLVTVTVTGDLGAVQSAVEAGRAALQRLPGGRLIASNVIASPAYDAAIFAPKGSCCIPNKNKKNICGVGNALTIKGAITTTQGKNPKGGDSNT